MEEGGGPGGRGVPGALPARPVAGGADVLPPRRPEPWWPLHTWPRPGPGPAGLGGAGAAPPSSVPSFGFVSARSWGPRGDPAPAARLCVCSRAPQCSRAVLPGLGARLPASCAAARPGRGCSARPLQSVTCPHAARGPRLHVPRGGGAAPRGRGSRCSHDAPPTRNPKLLRIPGALMLCSEALTPAASLPRFPQVSVSSSVQWACKPGMMTHTCHPSILKVGEEN